MIFAAKIEIAEIAEKKKIYKIYNNNIFTNNEKYIHDF